MAGLAERFEAKVDRTVTITGTGAEKADGSGVLKVAGNVVTAQRVAWELANGPVLPDARIRGCPANPACVGPEHLAISGGTESSARARRRAPRGGGSKSEVRPGVWKLSVTAGRYTDRKVRRVHRTIRADSDSDAAQALAAFVAEVHECPPANSRAERDVTVNEAI